MAGEGKTAQPRNRRVPPKPAKRQSQAGAALGQGVRTVWSLIQRLAIRLKRPGLIALRIAGACLAVGGLWSVGKLLQHHLTTSAAFAIESIEVEGLKRMDRGELLEAAGLELGRNSFEQGPEAVRARLLTHPWLSSAEVTRRLPGRFEIKVQEREPVALLLVEACGAGDAQSEDPLCDEASSLYLVSEAGHVFKRVEGEDPVDLPVITGADRKRFGTGAEFQRGVLLDAVALLSAYRGVGLSQRLPVGEIHIEPNDALSVYVGEQLTLVRLGHSPFEQKLRRMKKVFDRLENERASAEYVYLDNERRPDRVTVRLR